MKTNALFEPENGDFVKFIDEIHSLSAHNAAINKAAAEQKLNGDMAGSRSTAKSMRSIRKQHENTMQEISSSARKANNSLTSGSCAHNVDFSAGQNRFSRKQPVLHTRDSNFNRASSSFKGSERFKSKDRSFERNESNFSRKDSSFYSHNSASAPQARQADRSATMGTAKSNSAQAGAPASGGSGNFTGLNGQKNPVQRRSNNARQQAALTGAVPGQAGGSAGNNMTDNVQGMAKGSSGSKKDNRFLPLIMFWTMGVLMLILGNFNIEEAVPIMVFMFIVPFFITMNAVKKSRNRQ